MNMKLAIAALACIVSVAAWAGEMTGAASATGTQERMTAQAQFGKLDTNHDGYVSKREAKANPALYKEWKRADANHDGKLDQAEFAQFETGGAMGTTPATK
ncbi:MAG: hypothetical protein P8090_13500 [Gammaproteobacteria bacterium]|jgi:Ca2+-binding EF-hand superfamily protein